MEKLSEKIRFAYKRNVTNQKTRTIADKQYEMVTQFVSDYELGTAVYVQINENEISIRINTTAEDHILVFNKREYFPLETEELFMDLILHNRICWINRQTVEKELEIETDYKFFPDGLAIFNLYINYLTGDPRNILMSEGHCLEALFAEYLNIDVEGKTSVDILGVSDDILKAVKDEDLVKIIVSREVSLNDLQAVYAAHKEWIDENGCNRTQLEAWKKNSKITEEEFKDLIINYAGYYLYDKYVCTNKINVENAYYTYLDDVMGYLDENGKIEFGDELPFRF